MGLTNAYRSSRGILSGMLVGIGVIVNILSQNQYVGAMLFSLALLAIILLKLPLYTGKIGYATNYEHSILEYILMLVDNLLGIALIIMLTVVTKPEIQNLFKKMAGIKFSNSHFQLLIFGFMCGILMFIAVHCKNMIITIFCIMTFILSGYEHCIASFPFLLSSFTAMNVSKFLMIIIGNSLGSVVTHMLIGGRNNE